MSSEDESMNTEQAFDGMDRQGRSDPVYGFAAAPGSPIVFAGRASGLYRSTDGGATWRPVLEELGIIEPTPVVSVAVSPSFQQDRTVLAGVPGAALRSTDGGVAWQILPFPPPAPYLTVLAFSPNHLNDGVILAGTAEDGILRSSNGGDSWTYWNFGLLDLEILCLAVSPNFEWDETVYAGTSSGLFRSTNGGRAWKELHLPCGHVPVLSLAAGNPAGSTFPLFAGTEEHGLFFLEDDDGRTGFIRESAALQPGKTWSSIGSDQLKGAMNALLVSAGEESLCLGALEDGELLVSTDRGSNWQPVRAPGGGQEISAVFAPSQFGLELPLLVGFESGEIIRLERLQSYLDS
jgi:photosystem II stability/assembly factor-like uncharacterized protein